MGLRNRRSALAAAAAVIAVAVAATLSSCAQGAAFGQKLSEALQGVPATWQSYDQSGRVIDSVHGVSFKVSRDARFDTTEQNSDGTTTNKPGDVLLISLGDSHLSHVGSSACLVQDGIRPVAAAGTLTLSNVDPGTPFLNDLRERLQNQWKGRAKTIIIRSQDGLPIAVYAGNSVEVFPTDVPKSTWFRIDGKYLWCYRVDYTTVDTKLLTSK